MTKLKSTELMLPPELLRKLLRYDPDTGKLYWRRRDESISNKFKHFNMLFASQEAGYIGTLGYVKLTVLGCNVLAHRAIYAIMTGAWPEEQMDHINGDRSDNRWVNLRHVTHLQNSANKSGWSKKTSSGFIGVYRRPKGNWQACATKDGRRKCLGTFDSELAAAKARDAFVSSSNPYAKLNFPKETV